MISLKHVEMQVQGQVVKDTDIYRITDYHLEGITLSLTELKPGMSTRGHSHSNPETYFFQDDAILELGSKTESFERLVKKGEMVMIEAGIFHRVRTLDGGRPVRFICLFPGTREEKTVLYARLVISDGWKTESVRR